MIDFLIVDDDEVFRSRVSRALEKRGYVVRDAASVDDALSRCAKDVPQRALIDLRMPGASGLDLIPRLLEVNPTMKVVVLTGYGSIATTQSAIKSGAHAYITKPCDIDRILAAFESDQIAQAASQIKPPSLAQVEWDYIHRVLSDTQGNISRAARVLGMNRRSLQRKLAKSPNLH